MRSITYTIETRPIRWSRAGLNGKHFYDTQTREKLAYGLYILRCHGNQPLFHGPVHLEATFFMPIPKLKKQREETQWHTKLCDLDNLLKFCMDALTQTNRVWEDDKQVAKISAQKIYDEKPRTIITITELI